MIQKPLTTPIMISHIDYSPSGDVIMIYCKLVESGGLKVEGGDEPGISFKPGQFMLLTAQINGKIIKRSYSIATTPKLLQNEGLIGFSIKRVSDGIFSTRATQQAASGDTLTMTGPLGHMTDDESCDHYLLISAGIGLSPIYSIYRGLLESGRSVRVATIFGERYYGHVLSSVHQDRVETKLDGVYTQCFLSQDTYEGYNSGRVQQGISSAIKWLTSSDIRVFVCGAPVMVDDVRAILTNDYNIDSARIKFEKY